MTVRVLEGEIIEGPGFDPDLESDFQAFRDDMSQAELGSGTVRVYRIPLDDRGYPMARGQQSLLFDCPVGSMTLAEIIARTRKEFMRAGELKIVVRIMGTRPGERGAKFNKVLSIERPNESPADAKPAQNDIRELFATMQAAADRQAAQQQAMFERLMLAQQAAKPAQTFDPMQMMQGVIGMMAVAQKMFQPGGGVIGPAIAPPDPMEQLVKGITVMKQLNGMMNPPAADDGDGFAATIKNLAPLAKPLLEVFAETAKNRNLQTVRQVQRKPVQIPNAAKPATVEPIPNATEVPAAEPIPNATQENSMDISAVKELLAQLCEAAQSGADPAAAADELLDAIPEEYDDQIFNLVNSATTFNLQIRMLEPKCAQFPEWFEKLRVEVLSSYADPDTGETETGNNA